MPLHLHDRSFLAYLAISWDKAGALIAEILLPYTNKRTIRMSSTKEASAYPQEPFGIAHVDEGIERSWESNGQPSATLRGAQASGLQRARRPRSQGTRFPKEVS